MSAAAAAPERFAHNLDWLTEVMEKAVQSQPFEIVCLAESSLDFPRSVPLAFLVWFLGQPNSGNSLKIKPADPVITPTGGIAQAIKLSGVLTDFGHREFPVEILVRVNLLRTLLDQTTFEKAVDYNCNVNPNDEFDGNLHLLARFFFNGRNGCAVIIKKELDKLPDQLKEFYRNAKESRQEKRK